MTSVVNRTIVVVLSGAALLAVTRVTDAGIIQRKKSDDFDWRYEMDVSPSTQDLDGAGGADFSVGGGGSWGVSGGKFSYSTQPGQALYLDGGGSGIWPGKFSFADGYTIETRVKIAGGTSGTPSFAVFATPGDTSATTYFLVDVGHQGWGSSATSLGANDNSDGFHTFRIAQEAGAEKFNVWRDGFLLHDSLPSGYSYPPDSMWFADGSGSYHGDVDVDYFRMTSGAHAPPLQMKHSKDFDYKYEFDANPFNPAEVDLDNNSLADMTSAAAAPTGGILTLQDGQYVQAAGGGRIWEGMSLSAITGFTAEFSLKVDQQTGSEGAFAFVMAPGDSSAWTILEIGDEFAQWMIGSSRVVLDTKDNTDDFHTFRIMMEAGTETWYVWRDGELLSDSLPRSRTYSGLSDMWFGDGGGSYGGVTQLDWVRFTPGEFTVVPEPATLVLLGLGALAMLPVTRRRKKS